MMKRGTHYLFRFLISLGILFAVGDLIGQTCPDGMISYFKFQEISGPNYDDSFGGHDAFAPVSAPTVTSGVSGNAQLFNALSQNYINIPDHSDFDWGGSESFSIEFWVKFSGNTGQTQVFLGRDESSNNMQWWIGATISGNIRFFMQASSGENASFTTSATWNNGIWHHVAVVRDGSIGRNYLYVDGNLQNPGGTSLPTGGTFGSASPITVGNLIFSGTPDYFSTAAIDEIAFYDRALDETNDIVPHYNNLRLYQIGYCDSENPLIFSTPVTEALVGELYTYNVDASGNSVPTYSLIVAPTGMTINAVTGLISWTPSSISQNGRVIVRATNDKGYVDQEFNIYIGDTPSCRPNLIAYWDFNGSDSPPYIDKMANYVMTGSGPQSVPGISGQGLQFDGVNDSINMKDSFEPDRVFFDFDDVNNWSIEIWFKTNAVKEKTMVLVGREVEELNTQYWIGVNPDGKVGFFARDWPDPAQQAYLQGGSVLDGNWHHVVATYSESNNRIKLYVDQVLVDNQSINFYNFGGNSDLNVGMLNTSQDKYWFEGSIDELAFYNTQLSDLRVQENYTNGMAGLGACTFNHAPVISSTPDSTVEEGATYLYQVVASEYDPGDVLNITTVTKPDWLTLNYVPGASEATLTGTPGNDDIGPNPVTIRVSDGTVYVEQEFVIEVINVNDEPVITSTPTLMIDQGAMYSYTVVAEDADAGDTLTYSAPVKPSSFTFDPNTQVLSGIPTNDDVGLVDITVRVSDGTVDVDQVFQITVNDVPDAPEFTSEPVTEVFEGDNYIYTVVAIDPDGDPITYSAPVLPSWLSFDVNSHVLSGNPGDLLGFFDVTIRVTDGALTTDQVFQVHVQNKNDLPEFTSEPIEFMRLGESYLYQVTASDLDGDALTFTAENLPSWLTFVPASNAAILSGVPQASNLGVHAIVLKVSDGIGEVIQAYSLKVVDWAVGMDESDAIVQMVYPNPATDVVYFDLAEKAEATIQIIDVTGVTHKLLKSDGKSQVEVDISDLTDRMYFYKIIVGDRSTVGKLLID